MESESHGATIWNTKAQDSPGSPDKAASFQRYAQEIGKICSALYKLPEKTWAKRTCPCLYCRLVVRPEKKKHRVDRLLPRFGKEFHSFSFLALSSKFLSNASFDTSLEELARVVKAEHRIEDCLKRAKSEAGLSDYEVRTWAGWYHRQTLSLIALWFLILETRRGKKILLLRRFHRFESCCTYCCVEPTIASIPAGRNAM